MKLTIYAGPAWRTWNPDIALTKGDGGAHMAIVDLAPRLAKRGWDVTVYNECQGHEGVFGGVEWKYYPTAHKEDLGDLCIVWRRPEFLTESRRAKRVLFMARDMHYSQALQEKQGEHVACYAVLSEWHRDFWIQHYPFARNKTWVTRNGVDLSRFANPCERQEFKVAYTSAPYRGLDVALKAWPLVRRHVQNAELHVFYGFESSLQMAMRRKNQVLIRQLTDLSERVKSTPGVINHGRSSRAGIDQALMSSHIWLYPSVFDETSCAAIMEAQCAGCHVISNDRAALGESGRFGLQLDQTASPKDYADAMIVTFGKSLPDSSQARAAFDIETLADEWDMKFRELAA